jgi:hypothetical protein
MPVSQLDSIQFWTLIALVMLMASAGAWGAIQKSSRRGVGGGFGHGRNFRVWSICVVACVAFFADALVSQWKRPVPEIFDEFSYLLQADTFAQGRTTNPPPPLPEHFEAPYVLVRPTYQSKYPPAQALFLAAGQRLFSQPIAGVWLSSAVFAAALCWMLQAWLPAVWAFYGALLATCQLACFGHWSQSYWGGMVAATGGALVFGGLRRVVDAGPRKRDATVMALGVVILANSRPYEGLITVLPAAAMLIAGLRGGDREQASSGKRLRSWFRAGAFAVMGAMLAVFVAAGGLMAFYNQRVTRRPFALPYQAYEREYNPAPVLFFQHLRPLPDSSSPAMEASAVDALQEVHWAWRHFLDFVTSKLFFFWQFAFGAVLGSSLLLLVWLERQPWYVRGLQVAAYGAIQLIALYRFLFWPRPKEFLVAGLLLALLVQCGLLVRLFGGRWERLAMVTTALVVLAVAAESARFRTHYIASAIPLSLFLVTEALRRLWEASRQRRFAAVLIVAGLPLLALAMMAAASFASPTPVRIWAGKRAAMERELESQPGKQLVLVKYGEGHDYYEEWVYNHADLDHAKVVWARDLGDSANSALIDYFPDRKVWWLDADRYDLQPHPPNEGNELPLLP